MANVVQLISSASIKAPTGLWAIILNWIEKGVVNYGWVIILFTLLIKVCLMPLDFLVKFSTKKTTLAQQKLAPQLARINNKYQNDPVTARNQTNLLYKKEGVNSGLSCIIMLLNLVVTMVVFFSLFASLREMSAYKAINQYAELEQSFATEYSQHLDEVKQDFIKRFDETAETYHNLYEIEETLDGTIVSSLEYKDVTYESVKKALGFENTTDGEGNTVLGLLDNYFTIGNTLTIEQLATADLCFYFDTTNTQSPIRIRDLLDQSGEIAAKPAQDVVCEKWKSVKDDWLWVENIWVADNYKSPVPTYDDLRGLASSSKKKEYKNYVAAIDENLYNAVTGAVREKNERWNGYFILAVFAGVLSFLSQYISEKMNKPRKKEVSQYVDQANPQGGMMKFMKILLPALMVIFVLTSSAAFGLYIVVSSIISILISVLTSVIVDACFKKKQEEIYNQLEKEAVRSLKKKKRG